VGANLNTKLLAIEIKISLVGESRGSGGFLNRNPQLLLISILNKTKDQSFQKKKSTASNKKEWREYIASTDIKIWILGYEPF